MEKIQIIEMVDLLTEEFKIRKPRVKITNASAGCYFVDEHSICLTPKSWFGMENLTIHEFAHALVWERHGRIKRGKQTDWHGPAFAKCLIEIINAWYGDQSKYCWKREYKSLKAYEPKKIA